MGKLKNKLYRFMYGRYGTDTLGKVYLWTYIVVVLLYTVVSLFLPTDAKWPLLLMLGYYAISLTLIVLIFSRMFSRNIAKRRRENERFCGFFRLWKNRFRDRKTHVYRKCPKCHAVLRLPKAKGKHSVVCPRCSQRFKVKG